MRLRPIHFVPDVDEAVRFYGALGLQPEIRSRSGHWVELQASGGELGLHYAAIAADGEGREGDSSVLRTTDERWREIDVELLFLFGPLTLAVLRASLDA